MSRSEILTELYELRFDMDFIGESIDLENELKNLSDSELLKLLKEYNE